MTPDQKDEATATDATAFSTAAPMDFVVQLRGKPAAEVEADIKAVKAKREADDAKAAERAEKAASEKPAAKPVKK